MKMRKLGRNGPEVSAVGLGCMGMSAFYGGADEAQSIAVIHRALDLGVTLFDTAEMYGPHTNEVLLGKALKGRRDEAFIATAARLGNEPAALMELRQRLARHRDGAGVFDMQGFAADFTAVVTTLATRHGWQGID